MKDISLLCDYQFTMKDWAIDVPKCGIYADMGLGKTVACLLALKELFWRFEIGKVLIIAPLRVARKVWTDEMEEWEFLADHFTVSKIIGNADQRAAAIDVEADIYLINRENFRWLVDRYKPKSVKNFIQPWPWDCVVIDESSSFKSKSSERWKAWERIRYSIDRMIHLTGMPAPHSLMDLYSQVYMLDHGKRLGKSLRSYQERWFEYVVPREGAVYGHWRAKPGAKAEIYGLISDICISLRAEDYLELPEVVYNWINVDLTPSQTKIYRRMQRESVIELQGKKITAVNAGVCAGKLLQLANGAAYFDHPLWESFHSHKLDALEEVLDTTSDRVMIMYSFKSDLQRIRTMLTKFINARERKKDHLTFRKLETEQDEDDWNAGLIDFLILHPASAGHGLNLQYGGSTVVWFGLPWSLEHYKQANARIIGGHRVAGKHPIIHHIVTENTYDFIVKGTLEEREATQDDLMDALSVFATDILKEAA